MWTAVRAATLAPPPRPPWCPRPTARCSPTPGERIGHATNNVAEYRGLLLGLRLASELGATEVEVVNDSELVAKQVNGEYKVKHPDIKPLHAEAMRALRGFESWSIRSVPRAQNADADALVNQALDNGDDDEPSSKARTRRAARTTRSTC